MTLLVRDEADIVGEQIGFHLEHGVDFVVATDHRSTDGTTEILRGYEREGRLHLIREEADVLRQADWVTRMARLAATDFDADWVVNSDADELWWSREGSFRDVLEAIPPRFGAIRGLWRHFVPRPETPEPFYERMIVRRRSTLDFTSPYHAQVKVVHRATPDVVVTQGNHDAFGRGLELIREWCPFEVFHLPVRTRRQMERKFSAWEASSASGASTGRHAEVAAAAAHARSAEAVFRDLLVDDDELAAGLGDGTLAFDTRLRDALRRASGEPPLLISQLSIGDDVAFAEELDALLTTDAAVKLERRTDALDRRLSAVEAAAATVPGRALRRLARAAGRR